MNQNLFEAKLKEKGETVDDIARLLNIHPNTLYKKKNSKTEFTQGEIRMLKEHWGLAAEEVDAIFFSAKVS